MSFQSLSGIGTAITNPQALFLIGTSSSSTSTSIFQPLEAEEQAQLSNSMVTSVAAYDTAAQQAQAATSAASVANTGLTNIKSLLTQVQSLAQDAQSAQNTPDQQNFIQGQISLLLQRIDQISANTSFEGKPLLDGSISGYVPGANASAAVAQNSTLTSVAQPLVSSVTYSAGNAAIASGTFQLQVVNTGSAIATEVYFASAATGASAVLLTAIPGAAAAAYSYDGVTLNINAVASADTSATAYINVQGFVSASGATASEYSVTINPATKQTVSFGVQNMSTSALGIGGLNVDPGNSAWYTAAGANAVTLVNTAISIVTANQNSVNSASTALLNAAASNQIFAKSDGLLL